MLAVGTLTVGIGINAAMFALMDALLFRPPPHVAAPDEVVRVQLRVEGASGLIPRTHYPNVAALRASGAFAAVAAYDNASVSIGFGSDARLANALLVSDEFFRVLQPAPRLGGFPAVGGEAGEEWAVISDGFWRRHFGGEPDVVGAELAIDGHVHTVAGVLPSGFPNLGARAIDLWVSLDHVPAVGFVSPDWRDDREGWLAVVGRLARGVGRAVAEQRATAVVEDRRVEFDDGDGPVAVSMVSIVPGRGADPSLESDVSRWLAGVSAVVLLIACANVCHLALLRTFARRREHFIRLALGAPRWEFVRRSLCDTCLVVLPGAVGALLVSFLVRNGTAAFLSGQIPVSRQIWDARTAGILALSAALAFVLVWAAGAVSHLRTAAADTGWAALATDRGRLGGSTRRTLLAVQAALCFVLLSAAGLFAASLWRAESLDLGVELERTIQLTINFPPGPRDGRATRAAYERAAEVLRRHPGVERVAVAGSSPYRSGTAAAPWTDERGPAELWPPGRQPAYRSTVGAEFFSAVGAGSLRGRDFEAGDRAGAPLVAVVNEPLARHLWPSEDALGQCLWLEDAPTCVRVAGVLGGVWKFSALRRDVMALYLPLAQTPDAPAGALFVRARGNARAILAQARALVQSANPELPAAGAVLAADMVTPEFRPWRLGAAVFSAFAAVALLIASSGLYGTAAAAFALRRTEIAVRLALGARWTHVAGAAAGETVASAAGGLAAGLLLVLVGSRPLGGVLFETSPRDPAVLVQAAALLLAIAATAVAVPAVRALRTGPANLLRAGRESVP